MNFYLYLAGSSSEIPRVKAAAALIDRINTRNLGSAQIVITHRWWEEVEEVGSANPVNASFNQRLSWAKDDLDGVKSADFFWLLFPEHATLSGGCFWEAGYADALDTEMIISGPSIRSIFGSRGSEFEADAAAAQYLEDTVNNEFVEAVHEERPEQN